MVRLPDLKRAGDLSGDIAGQILLEGDAARNNLNVKREFVDGVVRYRLLVDVPGTNEARATRIDFKSGEDDARVYIDGPTCLRHRWGDDALCMWDPKAPPDERWLLTDGFPELVRQVQIHTYCEGVCRGGAPWPKEEMAGPHPRPRRCPTCKGQGR